MHTCQLRIGSEGAGIVLRAEIATVVTGGVVVLVAARFNTHADVGMAMLPASRLSM